MRTWRARSFLVGPAMALAAAIACGGAQNNAGPVLSASSSTPPAPIAGAPVSPTGSSGSPPATPPASGAPASGAGQFVITISNLRFSPLSIAVPPGATVTVVNTDDMPHSVTSEATPGAFAPGAVAGVSFDTGEFSSGTRRFTIPASAVAGTSVPYFCVVHRQAMSTPTGTVVVDPNAAAASGTGPATPQAPSSPMPDPGGMNGPMPGGMNGPMPGGMTMAP